MRRSFRMAAFGATLASLVVLLAGCAAIRRLTGPPADARVQVVSLQDVVTGDVPRLMALDLEEVDGVYRADGDIGRAEIKIWSRADVTPAVIEQALARRRQRGVFEAGKGTYLPPQGYPSDADARILTLRGEDVGALEPFVVPGKVTVFDFYADWCGPCKALDKRFATILQSRQDVAVRKLNIVGFSSPLAQRWALRLIPFVVIYGRNGRKAGEVSGTDPTKIALALGRATVARD